MLNKEPQGQFDNYATFFISTENLLEGTLPGDAIHP